MHKQPLLKLGSHPNRRFIDADDVQLECPIAKLLQFDKITSWDEVEIMCASAGIDVTKPIMDFFIVGMMVYKNITDMMISAFNERTYMIDKIKTVDDMALIYMIASTGYLGLYSKIDEQRASLVSKWENVAGIEEGEYPAYGSHEYIDKLSPFNPFYDFRMQHRNEFISYRTKIFNAIDMTNPFILLQFYSAFQKEVFAADTDFIKYLVGRTQLKAKYNSYFEAVYHWLKEDLKNINMYKMFMQ